jgi:hypothetical protein
MKVSPTCPPNKAEAIQGVVQYMRAVSNLPSFHRNPHLKKAIKAQMLICINENPCGTFIDLLNENHNSTQEVDAKCEQH